MPEVSANIANELEMTVDKYLSSEYLLNPYFRISKATPEIMRRYRSINTNSIKKIQILVLIFKYLVQFLLVVFQVFMSVIFYFQYLIYRRNIKSMDFAFLSHAIGQNIVQDTEDQFFALMPEYFKSEGFKIGVIYTNHNLFKYKRLLTKIQHKSGDIERYLLPKFLTPNENFSFLKAVLPQSIRCIKIAMILHNKDCIKSKILFSAAINFFRRDTYANYLLVQRVQEFSQISQFSKLFMTLEGHSYEQLIIDSLKKSDYQFESFYYQHSPITEAHLGLKSFFRQCKHDFTVFTTGEYYKKYLDGFFGSRQTIIIGSNKALKENDMNEFKKVENKKIDVLFAPEGTTGATIEILSLIEFFQREIPKYNLVLRYHPNLPYSKNIKRRVKKLSNSKNFLVSSNSLDWDLKNSKVVIYRSSAVGIEALKYNSTPIFFSEPGYDSLNVLPKSFQMSKESHTPTEALDMVIEAHNVRYSNRDRDFKRFFEALNYNALKKAVM